MKLASGPFGRVIVIVTRQIGDVLLTTPLIQAARERWPQAQIDVLGFAGTLGMLRGNPAVHEFIEVPAGSGWRQARQLLPRLWRRYDLALVAEASDRAHLYGWAAAPLRSSLVPQRASISWWKKRLSQHTVTIDDDGTPTVLEKLALLSPWGPPPSTVSVTPPQPQDLPAELQAQLRDAPVVVHVPSMWRYKQWPVKYFADVIQALLARGEQVVLTGAASEVDQAQVAGVRHLGGPPALIDASGKLNLNQVTTLLRRAALYVGPDTSITHLAAATGTPVITMFGPTNPVRWGPWPQGAAAATPWQRKQPHQAARKVILLQAEQDCVACGRAGCEDHRDSRSACLEALTPQRVIDECFRVLDAARKV
ncbi:glycosyltransferase family 9 protein [Piscinibacter sp. HJYY11]|uniref:glycosyltransferase family 9 protein n=1 Tax=Piscinibacter sp. HJYY11 TaxID=2801333 RepID=UPI00191FD609|nr:glycosyltransferase family 9 protein [Piscinibacter sp. HJYY11]MBL0727387.1 glycosyltransferase family 9 protein [Piscinibacter sp. HJYY11]